MADTLRKLDGGVDDALEGMIPMVWAQPPCFWPSRFKIIIKACSKVADGGQEEGVMLVASESENYNVFLGY